VAESLSAFLDAARARVDDALERYLPRPPACPALLAEAVRYSVFAGGKRLRPLLTLAAADAVARAENRGRVDFSGHARSDLPDPMSLALPAACAIELIHTYSLIHDDLPAMDDDVLRRGRPTLHVVYGDGLAILAGDALLTEAFVVMARDPESDDPAVTARRLRAIAIVAQAAGASGMVAGQALDLQAAGQTPGRALALDLEGLRDMHARKTGALIQAAATAGAVMGGAGDRLATAVGQYGAQIGLAFQIVDDILDVEGSADQLGKTAGKDAADRKPTYAALLGVEGARRAAAECRHRAHEVLAGANLTGSWLGPIADWIVNRRS
jgi:geranylgeranyl diphosphate synthase type II